MEHRDIGIGTLLPADEDSTESVHPAVGSLDDPASCSKSSTPLDALGLFAAGSDVSGESKFADKITDLAVVVAFIEAEPLRRCRCRSRPLDNDVLDRLTRELEVVDVRAGDGEPKGNALRLRQHAAFGAELGPVRWVGPGFFPLRAVLSTSRRPSTASPSRCRQTRRSCAALGSTPFQKPCLRSTRRSAGAPTSSCRSPWRSKRSTDSRSAARKGSRSSRSDPERASCGTRAGASDVEAVAARSAPTARPEFANHRLSIRVPSLADARLTHPWKSSPHRIVGDGPTWNHMDLPAYWDRPLVGSSGGRFGRCSRATAGSFRRTA